MKLVATAAAALMLVAGLPFRQAQAAAAQEDKNVTARIADPARLQVSPYPIRSSTNHWAFRPPAHPTVPNVPTREWSRDPIDQFILVQLEQRRLEPARQADKRTLIRRASFDLTGLPPTPEEVDSFLSDTSPEAFARVVDRLLKSPRFGERWGRHWLDVARYADSNGLEANVAYPNAWRYRDYVVDAFNNDKPYDAFIREQLAGDLLPSKSDDERFEHLIATGFLVLGPKALAESNPEKLALDVVDEQIDVTTRAFLGLTASCARCHDHKFDPIPTRDYYALAGIFKSTMTLTRASAQNIGTTRWLERPLASADQAKAIEEHTLKLNALVETLRRIRENPGGILSSKLPGIVVDNTAAALTGRWKESIGGTNGFVDKNYHHDANSDKGKMTARFVPKLPHTGRYQVLVSYEPRDNRATNVPVTVQYATGEQTVRIDQRQVPEFNGFTSVGEFDFMTGTNGAVVISNEGTKGYVVIDAAQFVPIDEWKLHLAEIEAESNMAMTMQSKAAGTPSVSAAPDAAALMAMNTSFTIGSQGYEQLEFRIGKLRSQAPPPAPAAMAVQDGMVANCRVRIRGDVDKLGPEVPRGFLTVLNPPSQPIAARDSSGRLELANWIASPDNPLTARVAVNRIWLHLFGRGIVDTPDNFGLLGEAPSHPELLDHLALRFIESGWSIKKMIRTVMLSSAYQMSCEFDERAYSTDPENRLLWRMNRRRLDAEALRDGILAVSGRLDLSTGGAVFPADRPPDAPPRMMLPQVASNRRSIYLPIRRNDLPDLLQVFDFGDPHAVFGKRHVTTTATQALFMMNSDFIQEQSRHFAERLLNEQGTDAERVNAAYEHAFGRPASATETERALGFIHSFPISDTTGPDGTRAFAWQTFCQVLFASTEFRCLN